jgi:hypothetical protein
MELIPLGIDGTWLAQSPVWSDDRGFFREWFKSVDANKAAKGDFIVEHIEYCSISQADEREIFHIANEKTIFPNGYNLTSGGNFCQQSEETQILKRNSMIGKNKGKIYPKRIRKNSEDNELPKYVRHYTDNSGKEGYRVSNHPTLKQKSFLRKSLTMNEKLQLALKYINAENAEIS